MEVSIITIVKNEADHIDRFLESIVSQVYKEFEIIIVDDGSTDGTLEKIARFDDPRLRCISAPRGRGVGFLRNVGLQHAKGEFVFFTDGDCAPSRYWIKEGLRLFNSETCVGIEGRTFYLYRTNITISDYNTETLFPGNYMTCNMAYRREILEEVGFFDPKFDYGHEDRDLAIRVKEKGKIIYAPDMLVCHQEKKLTAKSVLTRAMRAKNAVYLLRKHGTGKRWGARIIYPSHLLIIICPFLLISHYSYRSAKDVQIGLIKYVSLIIERFVIWYAAVKFRVFLL